MIVDRIRRRLKEKRRPPGRSVAVREDDTFIVSYPKSGNTWLRFLVGNLLSESDEPIDFMVFDQVIPDIYQNPRKILRAMPSPRVLKSHEYFDPRYPKVVYAVRDPRDVAVSYYYFLIKVRVLKSDTTLAAFVEQWLAGKPSYYGTWNENVGSWLGARKHSDRFLMIRYEDLLEQTHAEVERIASFLGLNASQDQIANAVTFSSSKNMKKLEQENQDSFSQLSVTRQDMSFIRSAKAGGWKKELSEESIKLIEDECSELMHQLDYQPVSHNVVA